MSFVKTAALAGLAAGMGLAASAAEVTVGVLVPYSGVYAALGQEIDDGFTLALERFNDSGTTFTLVREDSEAIGRDQLTVNEWCVAEGGHARTGLEDNLRLDRDTLAPSNAALVRRVVELCGRYGRPVASPAEARAILRLPEAVVA